MSQPKQRPVFYNPVAEAFDPVIAVHNGRYYLIGTSRGNQLTIQAADTLAGLGHAQPHVIYRGCGTELGCCTLWSPVLQYVRGRWYVYFSTTNHDHSQWADFVLEGSEDDPLGPYAYKATLRTGTAPNAIVGPSVFEMPDGRLFFTTTTFGFYIQPMLNPWTLTGSLVTIDDGRPTFDWEGGTCEVSRAIVHSVGDRTTVCAPYTTENYVIPRTDGAPSWSWCIGMFVNTSGDVLNPAAWTKSAQPVFTGGPETGLFQVLAVNTFKSPDGREDWMVYNALDVLDDWFGDRDTFVKQFSWNTDATPDFGRPTPLAEAITAPSGEPDAPAAEVPGTVLFQGRPPQSNGEMVLVGKPGWSDYHVELTIVHGSLDAGSGYAICARALDKDHCYALEVSGGGQRWALVRRESGASSELGAGAAAWRAGAPVQLRLTLNNERITAAARVSGEEWTVLASVLDNIYAYGKVGLHTWGEGTASFGPLTVVKELPTWGVYTGPGWQGTSLNAGLADRRAQADTWVQTALDHEANGRERPSDEPFHSDRWFVGGHSRRPEPAPGIDLTDCPSPAPEWVYQSERWSQKRFAYLVPSLEPGKPYRLRLHFAELVYDQPGQRTFNVAVNGATLLRDFDKVAAAGGRHRAIVQEFLVPASQFGQILIEFARGSTGDGEPTVSGIEVRPERSE